MTHALTIRIPDDLAELLRTAAFTQRRPAVDIIRTALAGYLDDLEAEPIDHIPTPRGRQALLDYRTNRRQQNPKGSTS